MSGKTSRTPLGSLSLENIVRRQVLTGWLCNEVIN